MPLPLTVSRSSKIQIGFTFLVPAYPGCPGKEAVKWLLLLLLLLLLSPGLSNEMGDRLSAGTSSHSVTSQLGQGPCRANLHKWGLAFL